MVCYSFTYKKLKKHNYCYTHNYYVKLAYYLHKKMAFCNNDTSVTANLIQCMGPQNYKPMTVKKPQYSGNAMICDNNLPHTSYLIDVIKTGHLSTVRNTYTARGENDRASIYSGLCNNYSSGCSGPTTGSRPHFNNFIDFCNSSGCNVPITTISRHVSGF